MLRLISLLLGFLMINAVASAGDTVFVQLPQGYDGILPGGYYQYSSSTNYSLLGSDMLILPDDSLILLFALRDEIHPDENIVLAKYLPYLPMWDPAFGTQGLVEGFFDTNTMQHVWSHVYDSSIALDSQGRILIVGVKNGQLFLTRVTADGEVDTTFGNNSYLMHSFGFNLLDTKNLLIDTANGDAMYVVGNLAENGNNDGVILKLDAAGALDSSFGIGGVSRTDSGADEAFLAGTLDSGGIIAVGRSGADSLMTRIDKTTGTPDTGFNSGMVKVMDYGLGQPDHLADVLFSIDGDFVATGGAGERPFAVSVEPDGSADIGFGMSGRVNFTAPYYMDDAAITSSAYAIEQDESGNLSIAGLINLIYSEFGSHVSYAPVWLLQPNGTPNFAFNHGVYFHEISNSGVNYTSLSEFGLLANGGFALLGHTVDYINLIRGARLLVTGLLPNLLVNSGFEEVNINGRPVGWTVKNKASLKVVCKDPSVYWAGDGSCVMKFKNGAPVPAIISQTITGTPETPIALEGQEINFNIRVKTFNTFWTDLRVTYADGTTVREKFKFAPVVYRTVTGNGTVPLLSHAADDIVGIKFTIKGGGKQKLFVFDSLSLTANEPGAMLPYRDVSSVPVLPLPMPSN